MGPKLVQKGIRNVFSFALGPKTRSFSILCTPATTHNEYLKQKDFYRIFHHRRARHTIYVLAAAACCGVVVYIFTPIHGKTTLRLYQIVLPPPHHVFRAFMIFLAPPGYVIFLAGFHPVVTTYKEYLKNQTNTSSPPRFRHI